MQEYAASEEREEGRRWRVFRIGDQEHRVDMKAIEPYKRVISHGGQRVAFYKPQWKLEMHSVEGATCALHTTRPYTCIYKNVFFILQVTTEMD